MKKEVFLDKFRCKGCGACEEVAPEAFKMTDDEKADFVGDDNVPDDVLEQAANICPTKCIEIEDAS